MQHYDPLATKIIYLTGTISVTTSIIDFNTTAIGWFTITDWISLISFTILITSFGVFQMPKILSKIKSLFKKKN